MTHALNYPFNLLKTSINLSPELIEKTYDLFQLHLQPHNNVCILDVYKLEIEKYIKDNIKSNKTKDPSNIKLRDPSNIKLLEYFNNNVFNKYLTGQKFNIEEFSRLFVKIKHDIVTIIKDMNNYFMILNGNKKNSNILFSNPISPSYIDYGLIFEDFFSKRITRNALGQDENNLKIALNVFLNGNLINLKMPSIGLIDFQYLNSGLNKKEYPTYLTFINYILNQVKDNPNDIHKYVPLKALQIGDTLADFLLSNRETLLSNNNLNNSNLFSNRYNNTKTREIIRDIINRIQINFYTIFLSKKSRGKNRDTDKYKVKPEYLIPYKLNNTNKSIVYMKKIEIEKELDTYEKTCFHNSRIMKFVIDKTILLYYTDKQKAIENLDLPNFKSVLACFIYILIRIIYNICKKYIDTINEIIISMSSSKKGQFYKLNYKDALDYMTLLDISLLNFRNVLLNNFYNMFLPSKISKMGYGITTDINGCFVPEEGTMFLCENVDILEKFPIVGCADIPIEHTGQLYSTGFGNGNSIYDVNNLKLIRFILSTGDKYDIYNKEKLLQIGGYVFNKDVMKIMSKLLKEYYLYIRSIIDFNLFIFEKIADYINIKKMIPFEVISDFDIYRSKMTGSIHWTNTGANYQSLERDVAAQFEYNLSKSTNYYKKMYSTKLKIKQVKQTDLSKLYSYEEMFNFSFNLYYRRAMVLYSMVKNLISNTKLKFSLLKTFNEKKAFYENEINQFIQSS